MTPGERGSAETRGASERGLVLVDSSVWIDYYRPRGDKTLQDEVRELLAEGRAATLDIVTVEVLRGAPDGESFQALRKDFSALRWLGVSRETAESAAHLGMRLREEGRAAPATDLLIAAAALAADCELWHRDADFEQIARVSELEERRL